MDAVGAFQCASCQQRIEGKSGICPICHKGVLHPIVGANTSGLSDELLLLDDPAPAEPAPAGSGAAVAATAAAAAPHPRRSPLARIGRAVRSVPRPVVMIAVGLVAILTARTIVARVQNRSTSVAGEQTLAHLGLSATFPAGWRQLEGEERASNGSAASLVEAMEIPREKLPSAGSWNTVSSTFFAGDPDEPDQLVVLGVATAGSLPLRAIVGEDPVAAVQPAARQLAREVLRRLDAGDIDVAECEPRSHPRAGAARCAGTVTVAGREMVAILTLWPRRDAFVVAVMVSRSDRKDATKAFDAFLRTVD